MKKCYVVWDDDMDYGEELIAICETRKTAEDIALKQLWNQNTDEEWEEAMENAGWAGKTLTHYLTYLLNNDETCVWIETRELRS